MNRRMRRITAYLLQSAAMVMVSVFGAALTNDLEALAGMDPSCVQSLDRSRRHFLFDTGSAVGSIETRGPVPASLAEAWLGQLVRTVIYEAHTLSMPCLSLDGGCGLSMHVPVSAYPDLNEYWIGMSGAYPINYSVLR